MTSERISRVWGTILLTITIFSLNLPAYAKYSGGTGELNDPYQIATFEDLMLLGETPDDYDKHFILTADIDLDPNLPGRKVFDKAVIGPDIDPNDKNHQFQGTLFTGVFDGNSHTISHLTIKGKNFLGLFGQIARQAEIRNLGAVDVNIAGSAGCVGGLVGSNGVKYSEQGGLLADCYSSGSVSGNEEVGGLVGYNRGSITASYSSGSVSGMENVGGLVGYLDYGSITNCCSRGIVSGNDDVGGLVGEVFESYSTITKSYSTSAVSGEREVGGLVGNYGFYPSLPFPGPKPTAPCFESFWDIETSGQLSSAGGEGKITNEMYDPNTFVSAGWDFVGENANGTNELWKMPEGGGYPALTTFGGYTPPELQGMGTMDDPYLISDALELGAIVHYSSYAHYRLVASIDLSGIRWATSVIPNFAGTFDGDGHIISHLTINGQYYLGLFGRLESSAQVMDLGVVDVNITSQYFYIGGLVGYNNYGSVIGSYSTGAISGDFYVGGLMGYSDGDVIQCYSDVSIDGWSDVGGLVGYNSGSIAMSHNTGTVSQQFGSTFQSCGGLVGMNWGSITTSYNTGAVSGSWSVGGLVGWNEGNIITSYSTGAVESTGYFSEYAGGLVGLNGSNVSKCYSTGVVNGQKFVGGLVGSNTNMYGKWVVSQSFWDIQTSGRTTSAAGVGKATAEMQMASTFLDAGWDFVGETANGTEDIWWIDEGKDYPRLWWELIPVN